MRTLLVFLLICFFMPGWAWQGNNNPQDTLLNPAAMDSAVKAMNRRTDSMLLVRDSDEIRRDQEINSRNLDAFMQLQKDNNAKQKKRAILQIAIGVGFLAILIIGLMRRRKKSV